MPSPNKVDRNALSNDRLRRNMQRLTLGALSSTINLNPNGGIQNTPSGLAIKLGPTGSTLLSTGSPGLDLDSQPSTTLFAGPSSGAAATPTFRQISTFIDNSTITVASTGLLQAFTSGGGSTAVQTYFLTRTLPATVGNYVEIGNFNITGGSHVFRISITTFGSSTGVSLAKTFIAATAFVVPATEQILPAYSDSGPFSGDNFVLTISASGGNAVTIKLLKTFGTDVATADIVVESCGSPSDIFTATSGTGTLALPATYYPSIPVWPVGLAFSPGLLGSDSVTNWNGTGSPIPLFVVSPLDNGGSTLAAAFPNITLIRNGIGAQSYSNIAEVKLSRYENVGTKARTRLTFALTHGDGDAIGTDILALHSNGNVGIGTLSPSTALDVASTGRFQHLQGGYGVPTSAAGAGLGSTGGSTSLTGTDVAGQLLVSTGVLPSAMAVIATITFANAYSTAPFVLFSPANSAAALLSGTTMVYPTATISTFAFNSGSAGLAASTTYLWNYHVIN